jgi:CBS-domain-containing membrane protein
MITYFKSILNKVFNLMEHKPSECMPTNTIDNCAEIVSIESQSRNLNSEKKTMLKYDDLLEGIEKVTSYDFCVMKSSEPLVNALSFLMLQDLKYIIIVDRDDKFLGFMNDILVLREFPPPDSTIPSEYQINDTNFHKKVRDSINHAKNQPIEDIFSVKLSFRCFYKNRTTILGAMEELVKPYEHYIDDKIIPVLNEKKTVVGVVSDKDILQFIRDEPLLVNTPVEVAFKTKFTDLFTLLPDTTLASAYFCIEYIPREYILICDEQENLLGWIDRRKVSPMAHALYHHLIKMPVREIMEPVANLDLIQLEQAISEVIKLFIDKNREAVVIVTKNQGNQQIPLGILTPKDVLQFFYANFQ